jgi:hypothetical protein
MILRRNDIQHDIARIELEIRRLFVFEGPLNINRNSILGVDGISSFIDIITNASDTTDIYRAFRNHDLLLENQRYAVEKSEQRRNIGYLQLEYDRFRGEEIGHHAGFQIGLRLPITNPDRPDLNRRMLDIVGEEADVTKDGQELRIERELSILDLEYSLEQHFQLSNYMTAKRSAYSIENYPVKDFNDISAILKIKEANLNLLNTRFEITSIIYEQYFNWLYISGKLVQMPLINYLDRDLKEL